jgi:hypothetical protein
VLVKKIECDMRLPAELWVKAYLKRLSAAGLFAAVVKRGDDMDGAIWVKVSRPDRTASLFGPAPAPLDSPPPHDGRDRRFLRMHKVDVIPDADAELQVRRARDFDGDLWIIEIEDRDGRHLLDDWLVDEA